MGKNKAAETNWNRREEGDGQAYGAVSAVAGVRVAAGVVLLIFIGGGVHAIRGRLRLVASVIIDVVVHGAVDGAATVGMRGGG